ncbi:protein SRC2 homolog [Coffea arabica]|uniref:Protein SRC2 homolog n=1 Tax=Coffea arabica TaxID=13443 RepID=A0ABM4VYN6_COFAR
MADCRDFHLIIISALDLKDVRHFGEMKDYAKVLISRNSEGLEWYTTVDKHGQTNPNWYTPVHCLIPEDAVQQEGQRDKLKLVIKYFGEVNIFLKELFEEQEEEEKEEY